MSARALRSILDHNVFRWILILGFSIITMASARCVSITIAGRVGTNTAINGVYNYGGSFNYNDTTGNKSFYHKAGLFVYATSTKWYIGSLLPSTSWNAQLASSGAEPIATGWSVWNGSAWVTDSAVTSTCTENGTVPTTCASGGWDGAYYVCPTAGYVLKQEPWKVNCTNSGCTEDLCCTDCSVGIHVAGRVGTNSGMNGIYWYGGTYTNNPYFNKTASTNLLYWLASQWYWVSSTTALGSTSLTAYLNNNGGGPQSTSTTWTVYNGSTFLADSAVTATCVPKVQPCVVEHGMNYSGTDTRSSTLSSIQACCAACGNETDCNYWSYVWSSRTCFRKATKTTSAASAAVTSGSKPTHTPTATVTATRVFTKVPTVSLTPSSTPYSTPSLTPTSTPVGTEVATDSATVTLSPPNLCRLPPLPVGVSVTDCDEYDETANLPILHTAETCTLGCSAEYFGYAMVNPCVVQNGNFTIDTNCTHGQVCSALTCSAGEELDGLSLTSTCAAMQCTVEECCVIDADALCWLPVDLPIGVEVTSCSRLQKQSAVNCSLSCAAGFFGSVAVRCSISGLNFTIQSTCTAGERCGEYGCPAGFYHIVSMDNSTCAGVNCTDVECCQAPTCNRSGFDETPFLCATNYGLKSSPNTIECPLGTCNDSLCCEVNYCQLPNPLPDGVTTAPGCVDQSNPFVSALSCSVSCGDGYVGMASAVCETPNSTLQIASNCTVGWGEKCGEHSCPIGYYHIVSMDNSTCAAVNCTDVECCQAPTCNRSGVDETPFRCATNYGLKASPETIECPLGTCNDSLCCEVGWQEKCGEHSCPIGYYHIVSMDNSTCAAVNCMDVECCQAVTCNRSEIDGAPYRCPTNYRLKASPNLIGCASGTCNDSLCCTVNLCRPPSPLPTGLRLLSGCGNQTLLRSPLGCTIGCAYGYFGDATVACDAHNGTFRISSNCTAGQTCAEFECPSTLVYRPTRNLTKNCTNPLCTSAECCADKALCTTFGCPVGTRPKNSPTNDGMCANVTCKAAECCNTTAVCSSAPCPLGSVWRSSPGSITCATAQCTPGECCMVTAVCTGFTGCFLSIGRLIRRDAANITCAARPCTAVECCQAAPLCGAYRCLPNTRSKGTTQPCPTYQCANDFCCSPIPTCADYDCPIGKYPKSTQLSLLQCFGATCVDSDCCITTAVCTSLPASVCPPTQHQVANASTVTCRASRCLTAECCAYARCTWPTAFSCPLGTILKSDAASLTCPNSQCQSPLCCKGTGICSNIACPAGKIHIANAQTTTCLSSPCSQKQCCYDTGICGLNMSCPVGSIPKASVLQQTCNSFPCSSTQCCEITAVCTGFNCAAPMLIFETNASKITCATKNCTSAECCYTPKCTLPALTQYQIEAVNCSGARPTVDCHLGCKASFVGTPAVVCGYSGVFEVVARCNPTCEKYRCASRQLKYPFNTVCYVTCDDATCCEPGCTLPSPIPTGYVSDPTQCKGFLAESKCKGISCASGYILSNGMTTADVSCRKNGSSFQLWGCSNENLKCSLPSPLPKGYKYDYRQCRGSLTVRDCRGVACAAGFEGSPIISCNGEGMKFNLSGCNPGCGINIPDDLSSKLNFMPEFCVAPAGTIQFFPFRAVDGPIWDVILPIAQDKAGSDSVAEGDLATTVLDFREFLDRVNQPMLHLTDDLILVNIDFGGFFDTDLLACPYNSGDMIRIRADVCSNAYGDQFSFGMSIRAVAASQKKNRAPESQFVIAFAASTVDFNALFGVTWMPVMKNVMFIAIQNMTAAAMRIPVQFELLGNFMGTSNYSGIVVGGDIVLPEMMGYRLTITIAGTFAATEVRLQGGVSGLTIPIIPDYVWIGAVGGFAYLPLTKNLSGGETFGLYGTFFVDGDWTSDPLQFGVIVQKSATSITVTGSLNTTKMLSWDSFSLRIKEMALFITIDSGFSGDSKSGKQPSACPPSCDPVEGGQKSLTGGIKARAYLAGVYIDCVIKMTKYDTASSVRLEVEQKENTGLTIAAILKTAMGITSTDLGVGWLQVIVTYVLTKLAIRNLVISVPIYSTAASEPIKLAADVDFSTFITYPLLIAYNRPKASAPASNGGRRGVGMRPFQQADGSGFSVRLCVDVESFFAQMKTMGWAKSSFSGSILLLFSGSGGTVTDINNVALPYSITLPTGAGVVAAVDLQKNSGFWKSISDWTRIQMAVLMLALGQVGSTTGLMISFSLVFQPVYIGLGYLNSALALQPIVIILEQ